MNTTYCRWRGSNCARMPDDGSAVLRCLELCMYILIHNILKWMKHMAEIALY